MLLSTISVEKRHVYVLLCLGCVTISFNVAAISAAVPVMAQNLQLSDLSVAKVIPYYMVPYGIGALFYAPLTRYFSYRKVLAFSLGLYAFACWSCGMGMTLNQILLARVLMGLSAAAAIPLGLILIGEFFRKEIRGRLVGMFFSCSFFASLAGVILGGLYSWRWLFFIPALLAAVTATGFALLKTAAMDKVHDGKINYWTLVTDRRIRRTFIFIFTISALYHGMHKWFGVYLSQIYGFDKLAISMFFVLGAIGGFCGQHIGGQLSDKKGRLQACYAGLVGLGVSSVALVAHYHIVLLAVIMTLVSCFWTIGHNGISTVLTDFPHTDRAVVAGLNSSVRFISGGLGFILSRYFVEYNFGWTFFSIGILMLLLFPFVKRVAAPSIS